MSDKIIWITGASRGIGASIRAELRDKYRLALTSRTEISKDSLNGNEKYYYHDASNYNRTIEIYKEIKSEIGKPDIIINNAGIGIFKPFIDFSINEFEETININAKGFFNLAKACLPDFIEAKSGAIINILSVASLKPFKNSSVYAASKNAVLAMSRSIREETRDFGIKIIDIFLGATDTDIWDTNSRAEFSDRMISPEHIAKTISKLIELNELSSEFIEELVIRPQKGDL